MEGVEAESLGEVLPSFLHAVHAQLAAGLDMERMAGVLTLRRRQYRARMEDSPADALITPLIKHFLYFETNSAGAAAEVSALAAATDTLGHLEELGKWSAAQWAALMEDQLLRRPMVCVQGRPSAALVQVRNRGGGAGVVGGGGR